METIHWKNLIKGEYSFSEVTDFFRAELRYYLFYHRNIKVRNLLPKHLIEQFQFRIDYMMDRECYMNGQCKICGCTTPDLQFTNATCKGNCYPSLMSKRNWSFFKEHTGHYTDESTHTQWYNMNYGVDKFKREHIKFIHKRQCRCGIEQQ